ncbi:HAD family phosphatase [Candidatus Haliotispira prima]|uniref:HAD family phosphatase n=1 Tax=Candidatus Haliotispira prima TaxID=3034016 RepID=A0ABY8MG93_9SPIO|nr:HAD family phosphatase [Candidatus Haliotispira prima]
MIAQTIHAVIFDLDGTLANSEPVYRQSERWLAEYLELPFGTESANSFIGLSTQEYMEWFRSEYNIQMNVQELCRLQTRLFLERGIRDVRPFHKVTDFLQSLHTKQILLGLASGSEKEIIRAIIRELDIETCFHTILSSSEVGEGKSKPAPDVFLECAGRLGVPAQYCLVLEDSVPGMQAARAAGMQVITINSQPQKDTDFEQETQRLAALQNADVFFPNPEEVDASHILRHFHICKR